ncbi:hypothetical protein AVEN_166615-1, partial [Araneus ventricosus]
MVARTMIPVLDDHLTTKVKVLENARIMALSLLETEIQRFLVKIP